MMEPPVGAKAVCISYPWQTSYWAAKLVAPYRSADENDRGIRASRSIQETQDELQATSHRRPLLASGLETPCALPTRQEAEANAQDLMMLWSAVHDETHVVEGDDPKLTVCRPKLTVCRRTD